MLAATAFITPFVTTVATLAHANDGALLGEARKVATMLPPKLLAALQEEMSKSGSAGAIPVCKDMAPKMADEVSRQTGWKIKRVSLKTRNDARAIPVSPAVKSALGQHYPNDRATGYSEGQIRGVISTRKPSNIHTSSMKHTYLSSLFFV